MLMSLPKSSRRSPARSSIWLGSTGMPAGAPRQADRGSKPAVADRRTKTLTTSDISAARFHACHYADRIQSAPRRRLTEKAPNPGSSTPRGCAASPGVATAGRGWAAACHRGDRGASDFFCARQASRSTASPTSLSRTEKSAEPYVKPEIRKTIFRVTWNERDLTKLDHVSTIRVKINARKLQPMRDRFRHANDIC
jgi:hypothetical protein